MFMQTNSPAQAAHRELIQLAIFIVIVAYFKDKMEMKWIIQESFTSLLLLIQKVPANY